MRPPELSLAKRQHLPEALQALVREYPRDIWESHDNFTDLTRFWLERHLMFREVLQRLRRETENFIAGDLEPRLFATHSARLTGFFLNQLHGHHTIEDQHYFPMLARAAPGLEAGFDLLDGDHHELVPLIDGLAKSTNAMLGALSEGPTQSVVGQVEADLQQFDRFLDRHLTDEEELVVPIILKYAPAEH